MSRGARFLAFDDKLAAGGIPRCSDWWRGQLVRFYDHPTAKVHVGRVGRGGAKSTTSAKCLTFEVLTGSWVVPPGERHWAINVSENIGEAMARQGQIAEYLDVLGVRHERSGEQIVLLDLPLGFWTRAARIGAVKGPRVVAWAVDEAASLSVEGVNPSRELVASLRAATVTHPGARGRVYSSPWGTTDMHYEMFERGDTAEQIASFAQSWVANPDVITEARSHELEPDERVWRREYAAEAIGSANGAFEPGDVDAMVSRTTSDLVGHHYPPIVPLDASAMKANGDGFVTTIAQWVIPDFDRTWAEHPEALLGGVDANGRPTWAIQRDERTGRVLVDPVHGWRFKPVLMIQRIVTHPPTLTADEVAEEIAFIAREHGARLVVGDQHGAFGWSAIFRRHGLRFQEVPYTTERKRDAAYELRRMMRERTIAVPPDATDPRELAAFLREAKAYESRITPSGNETLSAPRGQHDDRVCAALMTPAMADAEGLIPGSPFAPDRGRNTNAGMDARPV